jgi:triacylglycerol lipase
MLKHLAIAALIVLPVALCCYWILRLRKRRKWPRLPIVLAHGLMGFDQIELIGKRHHYFRSLPDQEQLSKMDVAIYRPRVAGSASIVKRAEALCAYVRALPEPRVNLVAHSMGGLDARYAITHLGLADRVASLTTLGTPHYGTPLAGLSTHILGDKLKLAVLRNVFDIDAFWDLTPEAMAQFNRQTPDVDSVFYGCVLASCRPPLMNPLLVPSYTYLRLRHGKKNDGLVPVSAQRWGTVLREIRADHWAQIGWSIGFDARSLFLELMRELRARGF